MACNGAVSYLRVSSKEQTKNLSIPVQDEACRTYCERHGLQLLKVFVEHGESAKTANRTALKEQLEYCKKHRGTVQFVVVLSVDRFARDMHDHAVLRRLLSSFGVSLRAVAQPIDESSTGKLLEGVLSAFAEFDNAQRRDKTVAGMKMAAEGGRWVWKAPIGYVNATGDRGKTLVPDPYRADLVRKAFELFATGIYDRNGVLKLVTDMGLRTRAGKPLAPQRFADLLRNPVYVGKLQAWGISCLGGWLPLVDEGTFNQVQVLLTGRRQPVAPKQRNHPDFPLRHFVRCGLCDKPLTASWSRGRSDRYAYYRCPGSKCGKVNVRRADLEGQFLDLLERLRPEPRYMNLFTAMVLEVWKRASDDVTARQEGLKKALADLEARKARLHDVYIYQQGIGRELYQEHLDQLNTDIAMAELDLHDARIEALDVEGILDFARYVLVNAGRMWIEASLDQKQRLQAVLFPRGVTYADGSFGTAVTCSVFSELQPIGEAGERLVAHTGFEPVLPA